MQTTWIIAANAGRARFFSETDSAEPLQELEDMVNSAAHLRESDLVTDENGPTSAEGSSHNIGSNAAAGFAHNAKSGAPNKAYQPAQTPSQHEAERFARDIAHYLKEAHQQGRFKQLIISASPEFLGVLRGLLDPQVKSAVKSEFNKDYTHSNAQELRAHLRDQQAKSH
jgi:protein required for attachment to host cells